MINSMPYCWKLGLCVDETSEHYHQSKAANLECSLCQVLGAALGVECWCRMLLELCSGSAETVGSVPHTPLRAGVPGAAKVQVLKGAARGGE